MKQRVISAILMLLAFIPIVIFGKVPFYILFSVLGIIGLYELLRLFKDIPVFLKWSSYIFALILMYINYNGKEVNHLFDYKIVLFITLFYFLAVVLVEDVKKYNYKEALLLIGSVLLIGSAFNGFMIIRNNGMWNLFYLFIISSLTDCFALFCGKLFGKHKVSKISPNKTIEGCIGGSLIGTIVAVIFAYYFNVTGLNIYLLIGVTFVLSIIGQFGDLFFSSIKRYYDIKDFGNLIPGHGGILDRLDSVIFILLGYILMLM